jgi:hypothetical protein
MRWLLGYVHVECTSACWWIPEANTGDVCFDIGPMKRSFFGTVGDGGHAILE